MQTTYGNTNQNRNLNDNYYIQHNSYDWLWSINSIYRLKLERKLGLPLKEKPYPNV